MVWSMIGNSVTVAQRVLTPQHSVLEFSSLRIFKLCVRNFEEFGTA